MTDGRQAVISIYYNLDIEYNNSKKAHQDRSNFHSEEQNYLG